MLLDFAAQEARRGGEPVELVAIFFRSDGLAVGHIQADDAHAIDRRCQHALLHIVVIGQRGDHFGAGRAGKKRDPVVGALSAKLQRVACGGKLHDWKLAVFKLGFLQPDDVRCVRGKPVQQPRQPDIKRVDVPGRDPQGHCGYEPFGATSGVTTCVVLVSDGAGVGGRPTAVVRGGGVFG